MSFTIDELYDALCWHPTGDIPPEVIEAAMEIRNLHVFVQPMLNPPERSKAVWDGCAMILARHSDEELRPHLSRLLEWLQDPNWPGARIIEARLLNMDRKYLQSALESSIRQARKLDDTEWLYWLTEFRQEYDAHHAE
ncbi:MAG: DUF5071 domain-containing protein [Clostridia bacterium]|nr:DUF5071 domain-containing protein [Clostridia bacterium]